MATNTNEVPETPAEMAEGFRKILAEGEAGDPSAPVPVPIDEALPEELAAEEPVPEAGDADAGELIPEAGEAAEVPDFPQQPVELEGAEWAIPSPGWEGQFAAPEAAPQSLEPAADLPEAAAALPTWAPEIPAALTAPAAWTLPTDAFAAFSTPIPAVATIDPFAFAPSVQFPSVCSGYGAFPSLPSLPWGLAGASCPALSYSGYLGSACPAGYLGGVSTAGYLGASFPASYPAFGACPAAFPSAGCFGSPFGLW
eukprot:NODE_1066_length_1020_cov_904.751802_g819_i1.p1 GENE.NODE_1066_length_1020_cov_904.751802_g819_i1~~NODE_1066_length_1020_cov_904.751802_g819_i1.p1  ORF type:complete len:255 (-),score=65.51 NODE_1066_length_1020_cov_904.751802_g819_i1:178-942(-)